MLKVKRLILGPVFTNTYILKDEKSGEAIIIDPADEAEVIKKAIEMEKISKVKLVILTHAHFDHVGALKEIQQFTGSPSAIHRSELELLKTVPVQAKLFGLAAEVPPEPEITLKEGDIIKLGEYELRVIETPGHSPGSISLFIPDEKILFSGDTLFRRSIGRTDLPGGNYQLLISSIKNKLFRLPDDTVAYPGHEEPTTIGEEKKYNPFLQGGIW